MLKAVTRQASLVDAKIRAINADLAAHNLRAPISTAYFFDHFATREDVSVMVTEQDFLDAHRELVPSVSAGELAHYERVRAAFEGGKEKEKDKDKEGVNGAANGPAPAEARLGLVGRRTTSGASARSVSGKGKGKAVVGKGKGKAVAVGSEDEYDDYEGDDGDERESGGEGYGVRDKGKGKEVAPPIAAAPFGDGAGSGDEGLYD
jgi:peroxin-6